MKRRQTTANILMVRPANFGFNEETADSNAFQSSEGKTESERIRQKAQEEFDLFVKNLRNAGVNVIVADDDEKTIKPDAVFPNNWVTFHEDGTVITYPMLSKLRRKERQEKFIADLREQFVVTERVHFETFENQEVILEGTGSLILDRVHQIAYACLSPRTDEKLLDAFCRKAGYEKMAFHAVDGNGQEIYHTNVMMALGETFVVICLDTVKTKTEREKLIQKFKETNKEIIEISLPQMMAFAGNMLQVKNKKGEGILVTSEQAYKSLEPTQIQRLQRHTKLFHSPIYTIEKYGGGSARCMMAEVFLPEKTASL